MKQTRLRNLPPGLALAPGMEFGRRTILEYVLNPLTRVVDESLGEPYGAIRAQRIAVQSSIYPDSVTD